MQVNAWLHTPNSAGDSPPVATLGLAGPISAADLNGGSTLGSSPPLYGSSPPQFYSAAEDATAGGLLQYYDTPMQNGGEATGPASSLQGSPLRSVGFATGGPAAQPGTPPAPAMLTAESFAQRQLAAAASGVDPLNLMLEFSSPPGSEPLERELWPELGPDFQAAAASRPTSAPMAQQIIQADGTAAPALAAAKGAASEGGGDAAGLPATTAAASPFAAQLSRSAPGTPVMRPEGQSAARQRLTSEEQQLAAALLPAAAGAAPAAGAATWGSPGTAAAGQAAAMPDAAQHVANLDGQGGQQRQPLQGGPQLSAIDQHLRAVASGASADMHAYTAGYRAAESAMQQQLAARDSELGNLQAQSLLRCLLVCDKAAC